MAGDGTVPDSHGTPGKRLTILSIDGGGVRGLIPAVCLVHLESELKKLDGPQARIADYFDVVAGTSTGGLIAAMLTAPDLNEKNRPKFTAEDVKQFYLDKAKEIFPSMHAPGWIGPQYSPRRLKDNLDKEFNDLKMKDAVTDVLLTTFDVKTQNPVFFSKEVAKRSDRYNARFVDVCLATSAAPTYFPPHQFEVPVPQNGGWVPYQYTLIDGGLAANNPTQVAILHAIKDLTIGESPHRDRIPSFSGYKDLLVLSFGTGAQTVEYKVEDMAGWGTGAWPRPMILFLLNNSEYLIDFDVSIRFQIDEVKENYLRLQTHGISMGDIDNSTDKNLQELVAKANNLLASASERRNVCNGELETTPSLGTNREALTRFAKCLSIEKRARQGKPTTGPATETTTGFPSRKTATSYV